jgi:hypothetical protein
MITLKHSGRLTILLAITALGLSATAVQATVTDDAEVVIQWNQLLQANIPATAGLFAPRYYAILHIAMFDAINSIEGDYKRYRVQVSAHPAASAEAAAAQAAHDVLVALIPTAEDTFDRALQGRLATIHSWRATQGSAVGKKVARAILQWRTGDGPSSRTFRICRRSSPACGSPQYQDKSPHSCSSATSSLLHSSRPRYTCPIRRLC